MALFGFGKKKKEEKVCCCSCSCSAEDAKITNECCSEKSDAICCIKVLGAGCKSCHQQFENAKKAVESMELNIGFEYITDMEKIAEYGVMSMPAIVVNEKVVSMGKVLGEKECINLFGGYING